MRNEEPPNKEVHADDLASALAKLHARAEYSSPTEEAGPQLPSPLTKNKRSRSSTIVYHPQDHGDSPDLPAIAVEDTTDVDETSDGLVLGSPIDGTEKARIVHTTRPPVELMHDA